MTLDVHRLLASAHDPAGRPLAGVAIHRAGRGRPQSTGDAGEPVALLVAPGESLVVHASRSDRVPAEVVVEVAPLPYETEVALELALLDSLGALWIDVTAPDGQPATFRATFRSPASSERVSDIDASEHADGAFHLPPRTYVVEVHPYVWGPGGFVHWLAPIEQVVSIRAGEEARLAFRAREGARLELRYSVPGARTPLAALRIGPRAGALRRVDPRWQEDGGIVEGSHPPADTWCWVEGLLGGEVTLRLEAPGFESAEAALTLVEGETTVVELALEPDSVRRW